MYVVSKPFLAWNDYGISMKLQRNVEEVLWTLFPALLTFYNDCTITNDKNRKQTGVQSTEFIKS